MDLQKPSCSGQLPPRCSALPALCGNGGVQQTASHLPDTELITETWADTVAGAKEGVSQALKSPEAVKQSSAPNKTYQAKFLSGVISLSHPNT